MKHAHRLLFVACWLALGWQGTAFAQSGAAGVATPDPSLQPMPGLGQLIARDPQAGNFVRLGIDRYHVNVVLQPPVALVQIDQSFLNPYNVVQEGIFVFNLPENAAVSRFAMYVTPAQLIEGELIDRARAASVYQSIVSARRDPAILEQLGSNLFRMRVFPIFAHDTKRILLDFTVPLVEDRGSYEFSLPMLNDLKPIADFQITGRVAAPFDLQTLKIPNLPKLKIERRPDGGATFHAAAQFVQPPTHLSVSYQLQAESPPLARVYEVAQSEKSDATGQYYAITIPASMNPLQAQEPEPADVMVLVDTSGSINNLPVAAKVARGIAERLRPQDRLQLGCVDAAFRPITSDWILGGHSEPLQHALKQLDTEFPLGSSSLDTTFLEAVQHMGNPAVGRRQVLLYIGDGLTSGTQQLDLFRDESFGIKGKLVAAVLTADSADATWLAQGVKETGGRLFTLTSGQHAQRDAINWVRAGFPRAARVENAVASGTKSTDLYVDAAWPVGQELQIVGLRAKGPALTASLMVEGMKFEVRPQIVLSDVGDVFIGRWWAQRRLKQQLEAHPSPGSTVRSQIVELCQEWSLMSPHTAFLVLESEADYARWGIPRAARRRYWEPRGSVASEPVTGRTESSKAALARAEEARRESENARRAQEKRFAAEQLKLILAALDQQDFETAQKRLIETPARLRDFDLTAFNAAAKRLRDHFAQEQSWRQLGDERRLFDRSISKAGPSLLLLPITDTRPNAEYVERNPHYETLLKRYQLPANQLRLGEFATWLSEETGVRFRLDRMQLESAGITTDTPLDLEGLSGMSLESILAHALRLHNIQYIDERHAICFTPLAHSMKPITRIYPVADLICDDSLPAIERLSSPLFEAREASRKRIESRLNTEISGTFNEEPLKVVASKIAATLKIPILLDKPVLEAAGITEDTPVIGDFRDLPGDAALDELLAEHNLTWTIRHEAIVITTEEDAREAIQRRVYSTAGLFFHHTGIKPDASDERTPISLESGAFRTPSGAVRGFSGIGWLGGLAGGGLGGEGTFPGNMAGASVPADGAAVESPRLGAASQSPLSDSSLGISQILPAQQNTIDRFEPTLSLRIIQRQTPHFQNRSPTSAENNLRDQIHRGIGTNWENRDAHLSLHPVSRSMVIRQSASEHRRIAKLLTDLRKLPVASDDLSTSASGGNTASQSDFNSLIDVLRDGIEFGPDYDSPFKQKFIPNEPTQSLIARHSAPDHTVIEETLLQLRRAKYLSRLGSRSQLPSDVNHAWSQLSRFKMTPWQVIQPPTVRVKTDAQQRELTHELSLLSIRKAPSQSQQKWRHRSSDQTSQNLVVTHTAERLELRHPERILRIEGRQAAVAYPEFGLVEINDWGDQARQSIDQELPWLPHRSNAELAEMFTVSQEQDDDKSRTLKLIQPHTPHAFVLATFDKTSGLPTAWQGYVRNKLSYQLTMIPQRVTAHLPAHPNAAQASPIEQWELVDSSGTAAIEPLRSGWNTWFITDETETGSPLDQICDIIQHGKPASARKLLRDLLTQHPDQAFLHFLSAWLDELHVRPDKLPTPDQLASLKTVVQSGRSGLMCLIDGRRFVSLGAGGVLKLFAQEPIGTMPESLAWHLSDQALQAGQGELGLKYLNRAVGEAAHAQSDNAASPSILEQSLRRIQLLALQDPDKAVELATALPRDPKSWEWLLLAAESLANAERPEAAARLFDEVINHPSHTPHERSGLLVRKAGSQTDYERWRALIAATEQLPEDEQGTHGYLETVLEESPDSATLMRLLKTISSRRLSLRLRAFAADHADDETLRLRLVAELAQERWDNELVVSPLWVVRHWLKEPTRIVDYAYSLLRQGYVLDEPTLIEVGHALNAQGRAKEYQRIQSRRLEKNSQPPSDINPNILGGGVGFF